MMELVSTVTVGAGGAASIDFTNIPQTGKDLLVVLSLRDSTTNGSVSITINSDTTSTNYRRRVLEGDGASASSSSASARPYAQIPISTTTASTFGNTQFYISNYTAAANKSINIDYVTENNSTTAYQGIVAGSWLNTSAITSISFIRDLVQYSNASLYIVS